MAEADKFNEISEQDRQAFERWIRQPPFELEPRRFPDNPERFAWPGTYRDIGVDLAWNAWCVSLLAERSRWRASS